VDTENFQELSIGQLAKRSGLATSAIRFYESRGLLRPRRTEGGQRRYPLEAELTLRRLRFAQSAGFTLSEVTELLGPVPEGEALFGHWQSLAEQKMAQLDTVIAQATEMKRLLGQAMACACHQPEECGLLN